MAWTKVKTAVVVASGILLAAGTTTVVVEKVSHPRLSATDLSWADDSRHWALDSRVLEKLPSGVAIFRPTRFPRSGGGVWTGTRFCTENYSVPELIGSAYGSPATRTVFPAGLPPDRFDVMLTRPDSAAWLRAELEKRFGLTVRRETRVVDVLQLTVKNPNPPNLKRHSGNDSNSSWIGGSRKNTIRNQSLGGFFGSIESRVGQPVLDRTGLTGRFDVEFQWPSQPGESEKNAYKRALLEQLGLELIPSREPVELLIVEMAK